MFDSVDALDPQLTVLQRVEREAARVFVAQCDALLELWDTAAEDTRSGRRPQVLAEAGVALHLHPLSVGSRLGVADVLRAHPLVRGLLLSGRLGVAHALAVGEEVAPLGDPALADRVLQQVLASDGRLGWDGTPSELRRALARAVVRLDPEGAARRRQEQTRERTGVRLRAEHDGLASWRVTGPGVPLSAADRMLDELSRPAGPDDTRTHGQRQFDALVGALVARTGGVPLELELDIPVQVTDTSPVRGCAPEPLAIAADLSPELLALLATTDSAHGEPAPSNPAPHHEPMAAAASPTEQPETEQPKTEQPASDQPVPDHPAGRPRRAVQRDGVAELVGLGPVDPALLAALLSDPAVLPVGIRSVTVRRSCVDRTGQVVAVDDRTTPLSRLLPPAATAAALLARLLQGLPTPPPMTETHDPTAAQRRVVRARARRCTFPGCGRRARRSELDHRLRHPDGPTSVTNLHPLCAHHHHLKHDGWQCHRTDDGATHWTSPRGQHLRVLRR